MVQLQFSDGMLTLDTARGCVTALSVGTKTLLAEESPLFRFCIRTPGSETQVISSVDGKLCKKECGGNACSVLFRL